MPTDSTAYALSYLERTTTYPHVLDQCKRGDLERALFYRVLELLEEPILSLKVLRFCECKVLSVAEENFIAHVRDLLPFAEVVDPQQTFEIDEVSNSDVPLIQAGQAFEYVEILYTSRVGQRTHSSALYFRK
jgi:hypothetical protein